MQQNELTRTAADNGLMFYAIQVVCMHAWVGFEMSKNSLYNYLKK